MFNPTVHPDWYRDGVDAGEELWRLDPAPDIQVQLFAVPADEDDPECGTFYTPRLFIERDVRDHTGDNRVFYSCVARPLLDEEAAALLALDNAGALALLTGDIADLLAQPDMPEFRRRRWR